MKAQQEPVSSNRHTSSERIARCGLVYRTIFFSIYTYMHNPSFTPSFTILHPSKTFGALVRSLGFGKFRVSVNGAQTRVLHACVKNFLLFKSELYITWIFQFYFWPTINNSHYVWARAPNIPVGGSFVLQAGQSFNHFIWTRNMMFRVFYNENWPEHFRIFRNKKKQFIANFSLSGVFEKKSYEQNSLQKSSLDIIF